MKTKVLFLVILFFGVISRFAYLEQIPTFISQDELGYIVNAKAVSVSGTDVTGTWNPWSLTPVTPWLAELPTQLMVPFFLLPIPTTVAARLPFVILSLIVPFALAGISREFFKSRSAQNWTLLIAMFNPWIWQFSRMSFDPFFSFSFYVIGAYLLIKLTSWNKLISFLPFLIGFYTYQGHKLVFLFWILFFMVFALKASFNTANNIVETLQKLKDKRNIPTFLVGIFSVLLFSFYVLMQLPNHSSSSRTNTFFTPGNPEIATQVNVERSLSLKSDLAEVFINKYTVWTGELFEKFIHTYSFETLFLEGQANNSAFSVWNHGYFYIIDSILILAGILYLFSKKRYRLLLLFGFGFVSFVVTYLIAQGESYLFRSSLNIPLFILLAGLGADAIQKSIPKFTKIVLPILYLTSIFYFSFLYFYRYPVLAAERQYFNEQVVVEYIKRIQNLYPNQKIVIFDPESDNTAWFYITYAELYDKLSAEEIQNAKKDGVYTFENVQITGKCQPSNPEDFSELIISENNARVCDSSELSFLGEPTTNKKNPHSRLIQVNAIKDSGIVYRIFNDQLCSGAGLNRFIHIDSLEQFNFKSLSNLEFCQTWISDSE